MRDLDWSAGEKKTARAAFDAAFVRECSAIKREAESMLQRTPDAAGVWSVHDYLSEKRREVDRKYDYRYSVLISVFGRLLSEGWVTEAELAKLKPEKIELIRSNAAMWSDVDA